MDRKIGQENTKAMYKQYLKSLPIWDYFDNFQVDLKNLEHELKKYTDRLDKQAERISKLKKLNLTNEPIILPLNSAHKDYDIERVYTKVNGNFQLKEALANKTREQQKRAYEDPFRDESVRKLELELHPNEEIFAMIKSDKPWVKCRILSVFRRPIRDARNRPLVTFRLRASEEYHSRVVDVDKFMVARFQNHGDQLKPSKRVIAGDTDTTMVAGIIGEEPADTNKNRYLVHFDDGSARYFKVNHVYPILGQTSFPWLDARQLNIFNPQNEAYLRYFFSIYPRKHILQATVGEKLEVIRNGTLVPATLIGLDCNSITLLYKDQTQESIYRGSPRLQRKADLIANQLANLKNLDHFNQTLLIRMHIYEEVSKRVLDDDIYQCIEDLGKKVFISRNQNTARKSTAKRTASPRKIKVSLDGETINEDRFAIEDFEENEESRAHKCQPYCLIEPGVTTEALIDDLVESFRNESDLKVPLLLGWKRKLNKVNVSTRNLKSKVVITYEAPCGKVFSQLFQISKYIKRTGSKFDIDYFSLDRDIELNRQIGNVDCFYYKQNMAVDAKTCKPLENKYISLINQYSEERIPCDFEYRNESFPHPVLKKKGFSFNEEFKSSCDCEDDCYQRASCPCHRLNEEAFGKTTSNRGTVESRCQYNYKRLNTQVPTGIFECNSFCKCSSKCSNRVVQNGIRFRLQVQKTLSKGWGVVTLDDIPPGSFICTYAAELLDDADLYGDSDMYYADLDYITVNEETKRVNSDDEKSDEGVDIESDDEVVVKKINKKVKRKNQLYILESSESSQDGAPMNDDGDSSSDVSSYTGDLPDSYLPKKSRSSSRYPKRKASTSQQQQAQQSNSRSANDPRIRERRPRFKKIHELLESHDYTLDARMQGNVGRFFNHSCDPNSIVQNVFIETHDLRFPVVAFFASKLIRATSEITWNYNYKMGSIPNRRIDCYCGASNCKGRIL